MAAGIQVVSAVSHTFHSWEHSLPRAAWQPEGAAAGPQPAAWDTLQPVCPWGEDFRTSSFAFWGFSVQVLGAKCEGLMITLLVISPLSVLMCSCSTLFPQPRKEANLFTLVCGWARESEET